MTMRGWENYLPPGVLGSDGRVKAEKPAKRSKYGNRKTTVDGLTFDSAKEARRWTELKALQATGEVYGLVRQVPFDLTVNDVSVGRYVADFYYFRTDASLPIIEDVKGMKTEIYKLKAKLMLACHGITIKEV